MYAIQWPKGFVPGFVDNFASNEMIVAGLSVADIWPLLSQPHEWPGYYDNAAEVRIHDGGGPELQLGDSFHFKTFGFQVECKVVECVEAHQGEPARIAWYGESGEGDDRLEVHHAWLIENLDADRVRILTQETQNGNPAKELASSKPNEMIDGHQNWINGLVATAKSRKS